MFPRIALPVPTNCNLFPQIAICSHKLQSVPQIIKSVPIDCRQSLFLQIIISSILFLHGSYPVPQITLSVPTEYNMFPNITIYYNMFPRITLSVSTDYNLFLKLQSVPQIVNFCNLDYNWFPKISICSHRLRNLFPQIAISSTDYEICSQRL